MSMLTVIVAGAIAMVLLIVALFLVCRRSYKRRAERAGYASIGDYLRAAPRTDEEKRDAVDLALIGLAICLLGLLFPPFILIGIFPLFHGTRKIAYTSMGLGLVDDAEHPGV